MAVRFIRWWYVDHGWPQKGEWLEVPDGLEADPLEMREYLIEHTNIPTWSERYDPSRVQWELVDRPSDSWLCEEIERANNRIKVNQRRITRYRNILKADVPI